MTSSFLCAKPETEEACRASAALSAEQHGITCTFCPFRSRHSVGISWCEYQSVDNGLNLQSVTWGLDGCDLHVCCRSLHRSVSERSKLTSLDRVRRSDTAQLSSAQRGARELCSSGPYILFEADEQRRRRSGVRMTYLEPVLLWMFVRLCGYKVVENGR
jgi:hypothetical protein